MRFIHTKKPFAQKALSLFLATALLVTIFIPMPLTAHAAPIEAEPTGVDGRILAAVWAGDTSDWVEIARNGDYSLIIRKEVLPIGSVAFDRRNVDTYQISDVRSVVNSWFNSTLPGAARLRNYTVGNNSFTQIGNFAEVTQGFSNPTTTKRSTGNDVAFLLSFAEAAMFCSKQYATSITTWTASPALAIANFNKLYIPPGAENTMGDFWWLRSPGHFATGTKTASSVGTHSTDIGSIVFASSALASYPFVRPALWVDSRIFETTGTVNITCLDVLTGEVIKSRSVTVTEGPYGPYEAEELRFYLPGELSPDSDPISGSLIGGDVINIIYLYMRGSASITIVNYNRWDDADITRSNYLVWAGPYGLYEPEELYGFGPGVLMPYSDSPFGELDVGQSITIVFGYYRELVTIIVIHELEPGGFEIYREVNAEALGHYGPYEPLASPFFEYIGLDPDSDPAEGVTTISGTVITIKFLYRMAM